MRRPERGKGQADSSESDWEEDHWDAVESEAMKALEAKLNEMLPGAPGSSAGSSSAAPRAQNMELLEDARRLQEVCLREKYRPEDHVFTAEEMWGGSSSSEEAEKPAEEPKLPAKAPQQGTSSQPQLRLLEVGLRPSASTTARLREKLPKGVVMADSKLVGMAGVSAQLQAACQGDPYRPEDHTLSAEEMWGGLDAKAPELPEDLEEPLTLEEFWGSALLAPPGRGPESSTQSAEQKVSNQSSGLQLTRPAAQTALSPEQRLGRLLAGEEAASQLSALSFEELEEVVSDCQRAVTTLRWALSRQRELLHCRS